MKALLLVLGFLAVALPVEAKVPMRRFALVISANDGGPSRPKLRYATTDAEAFGTVLRALGGLEDADRIDLAQPVQADLDRGFQAIEQAIEAARPDTERIELILYYSGHSDEDGLLVGDYNVPYSTLKAKLEAVHADVRIAILDSCASGAMTRAKGGTRRAPFLVDQATQVRGYAVLASSTESEAAQESDRVGASFFTHALITGLRGAADISKDGRVTLNEAYQFAFAETLARTSRTVQGPQHPTYDLQLVGSGDLVMTDLRSTAAALFLNEALEGRVWVRDGRGRLVAELDKHQGDAIELGLEPGDYQVLYEHGGQRVGGPVRLLEGGRSELQLAKLSPVAAELTRPRGEVEPEWLMVDVALFPPVAVASAISGPVEVGFAFNLVMSKSARLTGLALGSGLSWVDDRMRGVQLTGAGTVVGGDGTGLQTSGAFNLVGGALTGAQLSGGINSAGPGSRGLQVAGGLNFASSLDGAQVGVINVAGDLTGAQISVVNIGGHVRGLQLGVLNYSERNDGAAIGILSYARENGILSPTVFSSEIALVAGGLRIGTEHMYSILAAGGFLSTQRDGWSLGLGLGGRVRPVDQLYVDLDTILWSVHLGDDVEHGNLVTSTRLMVGFQFAEHFSVYLGPTFNVLVDVGDLDAAELAPGWATQKGSRVYLWPSATIGLAFN